MPNSTIVIKIAKVKEDFTKRGRKIIIGKNFVKNKNDFTGKEARVGVLQHFKAAFLAMRPQVEDSSMKSTQLFTTARDRERFTKVTLRNTPTPTETWINCFPLLCYTSASKLTSRIVVDRKTERCR